MSEGRHRVNQILKNYRPELTHYFSQVRALVDSASTRKSPIHESLRVTMLKIYGDYEEEAIEAVIESPSELMNDELRQIIYSL